MQRQIITTNNGCLRENQDEELKEISRPFPPIPAIKHWKPQASSSAMTLLISAPDNTDACSQGNKYTTNASTSEFRT